MAQVKLSAILDVLDEINEMTEAFLDRRTGQIIVLSEEELLAAQAEDEPDYCPEWQQKAIREARIILQAEVDQPDRYIAMKDHFDIDEWEMMHLFAESLPDHRQASSLLSSIRGRGAFRRFKDHIYQMQLADAWYRFREEQYRLEALQYAAALGLDVDVDA
jgi:hypothetical protein